MSKLKFKTGDFNIIENDLAAAMAQDIFDKWLEIQPMVYGHFDPNKLNGRIPAYWGPSEGDRFNDTHSARLVCIEEIKPKECEHEPVSYSNGCITMPLDELRWFLANNAECKKCRKKLKAKWEVI